MNVNAVVLSCLVAMPLAANAEVQVVERGPHHSVHEDIQPVVENGETILVTNRFTTLQSGMNYFSQENNSWMPASTEIDLAQVGAEFKRGPFKLKFSPNHNTPAGPLEFTLPDGRLTKLQTIGIALTHNPSGDSVWLGEPKDSNGILQDNTVLYPDAFAGVKADVRISVAIGKFSSDVILREQILAPQVFGWNEADCNLEVFHKIIEGPEPVGRPGFVTRQNGVADSDEQLDYGDMLIGQGTAFLIGTNQTPAAGVQGQIPVAKERFQDTATGVRWLIEKIPYSEAVDHLRTLPVPEEARVDRQTLKARLQASNATGMSAKRRNPVSLAFLDALPGKSVAPRKVAALTRGELPGSPGFLIDYTVLVGATGFTLRGDTTYYVTNEVNLFTSAVIEPGVVVKFDSGTAAKIQFHGTVDCQTLPYVPAVFTAKDDDTVGEPISGSTGSPGLEYGNFHLYFSTAHSGSLNIHNIRSRHARYAIGFYGSASHQAHNLQLLNCKSGVLAYGNSVTLRNVLIETAESALHAANNNAAFTVEHLTAHKIGKLLNPDGKSNVSASLANSLVVVATNTSTGVTYDSASQTLASDTDVFQTVGGGAHYLADASPYRDAGQTAISTNLTQGVFLYGTTYPPNVLSSSFSTSTILSPCVQRDRDTPDLGYHYAAVDYAVNNLAVSTSVTLTLTNGVAIACYGTNGLALGTSTKLISEGRPLFPNRIIRYNTVQEKATNWGSTATSMTLFSVSSAASQISLRITELAVLAYAPSSTRTYMTATSVVPGDFTMRDCQVYSAYAYFSHSGFSGTLGLTNNLFHRSALWIGFPLSTYSMNIWLKNNLLRYGSFSTSLQGTGSWAVRDNLFDNVSMSISYTTPTNSHNGYINTTALSGGTYSVTVTTGDYLTGVQGRWYLPTSGGNLSTLIDAGSQSAANASLYHYATRTDHTKDSSTVDIGYHVVAIDTGGPTDTDKDAIPDYLEDRNGDGSSSGDLMNFSTFTGLIGGGASGLVILTPLQP